MSLGALNFPKIPGVPAAKTKLHAWHFDFSSEPPKVGKEFPTLVPQVDVDGNEQSGIRLPELAVPLATYTGWNPRDPKTGAPEMISNMVGSFLPFPATKAAREKSGDPRLSIAERYSSKDEYLAPDHGGRRGPGEAALSARNRRAAHPRAGGGAVGFFDELIGLRIWVLIQAAGCRPSCRFPV